MCDTVRLDFTVRTGETCKAKYRANCCCYKVKCATTYITNDIKKKGQVQTPSGKHVTVYHNNVQTCEHIKEAV